MRRKSALVSRSLGAGFAIAVAALVALPARLAHADDEAAAEPCDPADGACDADAGASVQLDDGVIHLDGATGDAAAAREAQSGCSVSPGGGAGSSGGAALGWIPLPFAVGLTLVSARRRRRR